MSLRPPVFQLVVLAVFFTLTSLGVAGADDRTNIPLKNWGGFSLFRDAAYDDLERLVTAGLADRAILNTKPLNRTEAARLVARAIETIRQDQSGRFNARRDLEAVLDRLIEEFRTELAALGVKVSGLTAAPPGFVAFTPVDRAQVSGAWASHKTTFVNRQGTSLQEGFNGGLTFESRMQVGDFLTFYLQPQLTANEEYNAARLMSGYIKLSLCDVELLVGRDSLWWGPALHGSLILSNNAPPLDQIRIGTSEPFLLPWIGQWVGPIKLLAFVAQLEARAQHPRAKLAGMRATVSPFSFLELGISRVVQFGGDDRPRPDAADQLRVIFDPSAGDDRFVEPALRSNNLFAIDGELRLADVGRFGLPVRDVRVYGEFGWDDTCCSTSFFPLKAAVSWLVGVHLIDPLGQEGVDIRVEYADTSTLSYRHDQFERGYWTRGYVLSHVMGNEGSDWYVRSTKRISSDLMVGVEINRATIGSTFKDFERFKEKRFGGGIDISGRFLERYSLFTAYRLVNVKNRGFAPRADELEHIVQVELTRSFR